MVSWAKVVAAFAVAFLIWRVLAVMPAQAQGLPRPGSSSSAAPVDVLGTVADAGTLLRADKDAYANAFVASNMQPDGGPGRYYLITNTDGCAKMGAGSSSEICVANNTATHNFSSVVLPTTFIGQPACRTGQSCMWFSDAWGPGMFPRGSLPACAAGQAGGKVTLSTDNREYFCNGTAAQRVGLSLDGTASVDFSSMADGATASATVAVANATTTDVPTCSPLADPEAGLDVRYFRVASAGQVTIAVRNNSGGTLDPAAISWKCVVTR